MAIEVSPTVRIEDDEYWFEYSRASGPGGQHVNKVETRATLCLAIDKCKSLTAYQKGKIRQLLPGRISTRGILRVTSRRHRSRAANVRAATERLVELLTVALKPRKPRIRTKASRASKQRRLDTKRQRSQVKANRRRPRADD